MKKCGFLLNPSLIGHLDTDLLHEVHHRGELQAGQLGAELAPCEVLGVLRA